MTTITKTEIFLPPQITPPAPEEELFTLERFLATRHNGIRQQYLVRWKNYSPEHDSWHDGPKLKKGLDDFVRAMPTVV